MDSCSGGQDNQHPTRRQFLERASILSASALCFPETGISLFLAPSQNPTPQQLLDTGPANPPWRITMVSPDEPGEPILIRGVIFARDRKTPLAGARLYVYHTDSHGYYNEKHSFREPPRIRGWMKTNNLGQYEFRTIKPAPYPGRTIPAHIHPTADAPGYPARWIDEYWFDGDPFLKPEDIRKNAELGSFSKIVKLQRNSDGILTGVRDIALT